MRKFLTALCGFLLVAAGLIFFVLYPPIRASHPALTQGNLPDLVPLNAFYADHNARWRYRLSPDGKRIAWLEAKRLKPALWVRDLDGSETDIFHTSDEVRWYVWSSNGKYLLYLADRDGWENDKLVSIDASQPGAAPRTYDFGDDVRTFLVRVPTDSGSDVLISHNGRDRAKFDLHRLNLDTGETSSVGQVQERSTWWSFTPKGEIYARTRGLDQSRWVTELKNGEFWKPIASGGMEDAFWLLAPPDEDGKVLAISNRGRDTRALVKRHVISGEEEEIVAPKGVDLSWVAMHPVQNTPLMAVSFPGRQDRVFFDEKLESLISQIDAAKGNALHFVSSTSDFSKSIWEVESDTHGWSKYMIDNDEGTVELLGTPGIAKHADALSPTEPVFVEAQDGLSIPAFLTRAKGVSGPGPTVILIHGGPVARTLWGYDGLRNWLANRGYHVLDVNYRGSDGYGRAFREAAIGEVSRKMNSDIADARNWAVAEGIADPDKVAVLGGSWGGLQTMTALTENPELYAAGVNINGVTDLSTMLQEVPVYWTGWPDWYRKYLGDPNDPEQLAEIKRRSPLYNTDKVDDPVLVIQGANDVRVIRDQADRLVKALEEGGKYVTYELIPGAGHTFANWGWKTRILTNRKIERFLAEHLGGRADGFDYAILGAQILP